jgi:hypothetical protein
VILCGQRLGSMKKVDSIYQHDYTSFSIPFVAELERYVLLLKQRGILAVIESARGTESVIHMGSF